MSSVATIYKDISELSPPAQTACNLFMAKCRAAGLRVRITETYRSQARQNYLYEQGRTRPGAIVTWTKNSRHTKRIAWDICQDIKGKEYSDPGFFKACGEIAKKLGITWGGTWLKPDTPHFEISTSWQAPKESEADEMTEAEKKEFAKLQARVDFLEQEINRTVDKINTVANPMIYHYIDENMPEWARPTIQKLVRKGILSGNENGELGLTDEMLRLFVVLDRQGVFG